MVATAYQYYVDQAQKARQDADGATLDNVRERCLRSAAAWDEMAARVRRTERMRSDTEARKAAEAADKF